MFCSRTIKPLFYTIIFLDQTLTVLTLLSIQLIFWEHLFSGQKFTEHKAGCTLIRPSNDAIRYTYVYKL